MALITINRCVCGHTMVEHCDEDEEGLFFRGEGCSECDCPKLIQNALDPEVVEILL